MEIQEAVYRLPFFSFDNKPLVMTLRAICFPTCNLDFVLSLFPLLEVIPHHLTCETIHKGHILFRDTHEKHQVMQGLLRYSSRESPSSNHISITMQESITSNFSKQTILSSLGVRYLLSYLMISMGSYVHDKGKIETPSTPTTARDPSRPLTRENFPF